MSLLGVSYGDSRATCIGCIQIPSYEIDRYKEMFPLTIWTNSQIYDHNSIIKVNGHLRPQNYVAPVLAVVTNPIGNVVTVEQITPGPDGNFSFQLNTAGPLWTQNGEYVLKVKSSTETQQFKTKFTLVSSTLRSADKCSSSEISALATDGLIYCIPFKITEGLVTSTNGKLNFDTKTITLDMNGRNIESVTFEIPRQILDSKSPSGDDSVFIVTTNGNMTEYEELESNSTSRYIKLDYPSTDKATFEIIGTHVIPEFGSITLLMLIVSITSILIISRSVSNGFVKF